MSTEAQNRQTDLPDQSEPTPVEPTMSAQPRELPQGTLPGTTAVPPVLSGKALLRRGLVRWALMGAVRVAYRRWTRIAARLFPEDSRQAALAASLGIPLPDQLNMSWITTQLAVGGRVQPQDIHRLAASGVTRVVDTRSEHKDDEAALAAEGIKLLYLPAPDTTPLTLAQLRQGTAWINEQIADGQKVLIHCEHGVGRSVLLTAAALVAGGMNAHDAVTLVQRRRWQAAPNHRQVRRLQQFEQALHGQPQTTAS